jgi:hypothetical protein
MPVKATIWRNPTKRGGVFYSVEFTRTYKDDEGKYHDSPTFTGPELLQVAHLAAKAYDRIAKARIQDKDEG